MEIRTEEDLKAAFKVAAQTERLQLQDGNFPLFVLQEDIETMRYVVDNLLPKIKDLRARKIIWLWARGMCWKNIENAVELGDRHAKRVFSRTLKDILQSV